MHNPGPLRCNVPPKNEVIGKTAYEVKNVTSLTYLHLCAVSSSSCQKLFTKSIQSKQSIKLASNAAKPPRNQDVLCPGRFILLDVF